jgi:1-acyl-sn-glycerol-3-phosphate acyltransferase
LCRILGIRLQASGTVCQGPTFFVANHISWLDIFCIAAVCPTHFLAKQDVAAWPLFGWLCRRAGTAFIRRGDDSGAAMEQMVWRLRQGERILVFPEGTSTSGETVRRFFPRLFQAAILARCPVQAIALRYPRRDGRSGPHPTAPFIGDDELLPHLWRLLGEPAIDVKVHFGAIHAAPHSSRDVLARLTHAEISMQISSLQIPTAAATALEGQQG